MGEQSLQDFFFSPYSAFTYLEANRSAVQVDAAHIVETLCPDCWNNANDPVKERFGVPNGKPMGLYACMLCKKRRDGRLHWFVNKGNLNQHVKRHRSCKYGCGFSDLPR